MNKTVYVIVSVDEPLDQILNTIVDPYDGYKNIFYDLSLAQRQLNDYLAQGLEYTIRTIRLNIE